MNQTGVIAGVEAPEVKFTNKEVSEEEVKAAIKNYADEKQKQGSRQLATIFNTSAPRFGNNIITLTIQNETQKEQLLFIKQDFIDEIRKQLQNNSIGLEVVTSTHETQTKAYKPIDIFKAMSEKNPALLELKKRFDLEIDY